MNTGYDKAQYLLPFDYRHSDVKSRFKFDPPLSAQQAACVCDSKHLILLVPATEAQLQRMDGDRQAYDRDLRPTLMEAVAWLLESVGAFETARPANAPDILAGATP